MYVEKTDGKDGKKISGAGCMYSPEAPVGSIYSRKFNFLKKVEKNSL